MATQNYSTVASRNLIRAEMNMLKHAESIRVLGSLGAQEEQPKRKPDTVVFRRLVAFNAGSNEVASIAPANFVTAEGTTPTANTSTRPIPSADTPRAIPSPQNNRSR